MSQDKSWCADGVYCFSEKWQKVIDLEIEKNASDFVESLKVEILDVNSFTITHPNKNAFKVASLDDLKKSVAVSMEKVFGLEPIITWEEGNDVI